MQDRIFGEREKAMEEAFFRQEDARLIERLRQRAHLDDIALALGQKLQVDNPDLLERLRAKGISLDTAAALFAAPLVQVAWAGGSVSRAEHDVVLRLARERGIDPASPAYAQLEEWLRHRPDDDLFDIALETLKAGFAVLPPDEREERVKTLVEACHEVARASGSALIEQLLRLGNSVSTSEMTMLDQIAKTLRKRG